MCYTFQLEDLQDKENQLAVLSEEKDRNLKQNTQYFDKIKRDIDVTRKQLQHERSMKLDAFQRVDNLQAVVCITFSNRNQLVGSLTLYIEIYTHQDTR